jgi:hypothetical protein
MRIWGWVVQNRIVTIYVVVNWTSLVVDTCRATNPCDIGVFLQ